MKKINIFINILLFLLVSAISAFAEPDFIIITNKSNSINQIGANDLKAIFKMDKTFWSDKKKITVALLKPGNDKVEQFDKQIYKMNDIQLKKFWFNKIFANKISSLPKQFSSEAELIKFVASTPGAIGYISGEKTNSSVKKLRINGSL